MHNRACRIGDWGLGIGILAGIGWNMLEQAKIGQNRLKQAGTGWNKVGQAKTWLEQTGILEWTGKAGISWNGLEQVGIGGNWQENAGIGLLPHIPSYSSLFQPFQSITIYSNQFQPIPKSPISNPKSPIWNAQLCILSPIGHLCVSPLISLNLVSVFLYTQGF